LSKANALICQNSPINEIQITRAQGELAGLCLGLGVTSGW